MARKKRKSLIFTIMRMSVIPIAILGVVMTFYSQNSVHEGMVFEIEKSLSGIAHNLISIYNVLDAGDFSQKDDRVYKEETEITSDYRVLDDIKNDTGADVTVFVGDERCLTTLVDKKGNRLVGSHLDKEVASQVIEDGEEYFSQNVDVMGVRYFGYYVPIRNDENEVVGVSFAGESAESVNTSMRFMTQGNVIICLFIIILAGFICNLSAQKMVEAIQAIKRFLGRVSHGEFHHEMPENVLKRGDELAQMGEYAVAVSDSLEEMVSRDPLTKLLNRRAAQIQMDYRRENDCFSLAIADIDFFKSVNDSYGHEKGDEVLKYVAGALRKAVGEDGFSARWGGEEFLIGFDGTVNETRKVLQGFLDDVKSKKFSHNGMEFSISLTIGIVTYCEEEKMEEAINRADELLYYGKEHGRDQIVMESREEES